MDSDEFKKKKYEFEEYANCFDDNKANEHHLMF